MGKKRKHEENGMTSKPRDEMPLERSSDASPYSLLSDVLKQFEKHIQVKVNTDELVQKLEQRVHNLEEKVKVDTDEMVQKLEQTESLEQRVKKLEDKVKRNKSKEVQEKERISKIMEDHRTELNEFKEDLRKLNEYKEELRFEFHQEIRKLEDKVENRSTKCFSVLKQDFKKELEVKDEPSLGIQEEGRAKVHHLNESPSLRSQPHQSETTRFKLKIKNEVAQVVYKGKPIRTNDSEHITVVLYDGDNPIAPDHHLASAKVQLVVVDGDEPQGFLSKDDLQKKKMIPRNANNQNLVKNGIFALVDGKCRHKGVTVTDNSNRREFRLGVMIEGDTNERVLGELSNTFKVQEAKTEKDRAKRNTDDSTEDLLRYTPGQVHMTNKNGQGQRCSLQQAMPNFPIMANPPLHQAYMVQGAHKRHSSGSVGSLMANVLPQQGTSQLGNRGQVQQFQTTGQGQHYQTAGSMLSLMQNQSQITYGLTAGNGSAGPPSNNLQLYNTQQSVQLANYGQGRPHMLATHNNVPPPLCPFVVTPSTYAPVPGGMVGEVSGNGPGGEHIVDRVPRQNATQPGVQMDNHGNGSVDPRPVEHLQQYPTQQGINGLENCGQGRQHNSVTRNFAFSHVEAENGAGRVPQQNATQQGVQLDNHGQGRQHNSGTQTFAVMPSQTFANAAVGNGPGGELGVDDILQQNATQQGVQLDNHRSDLGLGLGLSTHNIPTGPSTGDVLDTLDETLRHLRANPTAPADPECSGFFLDPVAAHQLHMNYSSGMQFTFHPATEDGGSTASAPSTAAPAPEGAEMGFTQPTAMASWKP